VSVGRGSSLRSKAAANSRDTAWGDGGGGIGVSTVSYGRGPGENHRLLLQFEVARHSASGGEQMHRLRT